MLGRKVIYVRCINCSYIIFGLVEDKKLHMMGCSLIIVLRDILMCSILATTCMQGLVRDCLYVFCGHLLGKG